jgi:predicted MFS family arabinose efflux permease
LEAIPGSEPGAAEATPPSSGSPVRVLRNRTFRRLWIGSVTAAGGTAVGSIIITWLVYSSTHSPLAISLLGIVQFLPTLGFGLFAGALIDRLDRRRLMLSCDIARAACFGSLALYVLVYGVSLVVLLGAVFAVATFSTVFRPATNAAIPRILARQDLADGNGLLQGGTTIAQFVGSPVGGVLVLTVGAVVGFAFNALTFAISGTMILLIAIPAGARAASAGGRPRASLLSEVRDGLRFVASQRALLIITVTAMAANFFLTMWGAFMVIYAAVQLHEGAAGFSIIVAANTAGFAIGAIIPGRLHMDRAPGLWLLPSWGIVGFFLLGLSRTHSLTVAVALTVTAGALLSIGNTTWLSGVQRTVPDQYLGRYFATDEAGSYAMIPAGIALGGLFVFEFGIAWTYVIAGVGALLVNIPLFLSPTVRRWGRQTGAS